MSSGTTSSVASLVWREIVGQRRRKATSATIQPAAPGAAATVQGKSVSLKRPALAKGGTDPKAAATGRQKVYMEGKDLTATVYDRRKLRAGNRIKGPAIIVEMDSTSVILPKHHGVVDKVGCILIYPDGYKPARKAKR